MAQFFSAKGVFRHTLSITNPDTSSEESGTDKQYEIVQPALARYFHTHFQSGAQQIQLTLNKGSTDRPIGNGGHFIENPKANMIYWFEASHVSAVIQRCLEGGANPTSG